MEMRVLNIAVGSRGDQRGCWMEGGIRNWTEEDVWDEMDTIIEFLDRKP